MLKYDQFDRCFGKVLNVLSPMWSIHSEHIHSFKSKTKQTIYSLRNHKLNLNEFHLKQMLVCTVPESENHCPKFPLHLISECYLFIVRFQCFTIRPILINQNTELNNTIAAFHTKYQMFTNLTWNFLFQLE